MYCCLRCTALHCVDSTVSALHCCLSLHAALLTVLYCAPLCNALCAALYGMVLRRDALLFALSFSKLHFTELLCTAPHCTSLHYTAVHCIALHSVLHFYLFRSVIQSSTPPGGASVASGADIAVPARPIVPERTAQSLLSALLAPLLTAFLARLLMHIAAAARIQI